jgi:hypothetical protein
MAGRATDCCYHACRVWFFGEAVAGNEQRASQHSVATELRRLAWLLDDAIRLPGGFRIGLDGIVGLVPGIGDVLGLGASAYIVIRAKGLGVPRIVLTRMIGNVVLESVIGVIPVLGDLFDFAFKANRRNLALMEQYFVNEQPVRRGSRARVLLVMAIALALLAVLMFLAFRLVQWLWSLATI